MWRVADRPGHQGDQGDRERGQQHGTGHGYAAAADLAPAGRTPAAHPETGLPPTTRVPPSLRSRCSERIRRPMEQVELDRGAGSDGQLDGSSPVMVTSMTSADRAHPVLGL